MITGYPGYSNQNAHQLAPSYSGSSQSAGQGYNPPVGQQYHQQSNQPYNPSVGSPYQQSFGQPYNPSVGQSYNQPAGHPYNPSVGQPYHQPAGQPYNPPVGQPYQQPIGQPYNPPVGQTVILAPAQAPSSGGRGLGQIAKEAVVFAGINAGVNAAVNRLLPGGTRGGGSNTQITYNNYYNNQTDSQGNPVTPNTAVDASSTMKPGESSSVAPANPGTQAAGDPAIQNPTASAPVGIPPMNADTSNSGAAANGMAGQVSGNPMAPPAQTNLVSNEELVKLSQDLFEADINNAFKFITLKLQGQKTDDSVTDSATDP